MEEIQIGKISHYFGHIGVAAINLTAELKVGDTIHVKGHISDFIQKVDSIQVEHASIDIAKAGDSIGIKVKEHAREHDIVYKIIG